MIPDLFADYNRVYLAASSHCEGMRAVFAEIERDYPDPAARRTFMLNMGRFHPDWGFSDSIGLVRLGVSEEIRDRAYEALWRDGQAAGLAELALVYGKHDAAAYEDEIHRLAALPQWRLFALPDGSLTIVRSLDGQNAVAA